MFIEWCKNDICSGDAVQACPSISAYAKECMSANICVHWRTNLCPSRTCPPEKEYQPCGTNCPKTCDNIKEEKSSCFDIPVDDCFCPSGTVNILSVIDTYE